MMTAEQLKASILKMAMQGKLVEQRAEEGTSTEFFARVCEEKQKLIKAGKIKKSKSCAAIIENEIPFDIPSTWRWIRFEEIISLLSGADLTPDKYNALEKGTVYLTGASNIENGNIIINRWTEFPKNIAHKGDLLLTCKGTVGKTAILGLEEVHIARQIMAITPILCDVKYIDFFLQYIVESLKKKAKSMIPGIERSTVLNALFPLPPLEEQKRIVAKIEELMPFVEQYAKASTRLNTLNASFPDQMKKSILQQAVMGKLVPQAPNDEPASMLLEKIAAKCVIPEELENDINPNLHYAYLADACNGIYDCPHSTPTYCKEYEGYLCLRTRELKVGEIEWDKLLYITKDTYTDRVSRYVPRKNDIVYAREGRYGICAIIDKDTPLALGQHLMAFSLNHELLRPKYLFYALISDFCLGQVTSVQRGMTAAHVNVKDVKKMIVPIPSLKMQDKIISIVDYLLSEIETLNKSHDE